MVMYRLKLVSLPCWIVKAQLWVAVCLTRGILGVCGVGSVWPEVWTSTVVIYHLLFMML